MLLVNSNEHIQVKVQALVVAVVREMAANKRL
jgi:hypothetical protein